MSKKEINWNWEFYKLLGYRIVESEDEKILNDFMNEVIKKAKKGEI